MKDVSWVRVASRDSVPLREGRAVAIGGRDIALFNLGDEYLATDNGCPHQGGPLCDGIVTGRAVVCPLHAWKIDLGTGGVVRPAAQAEDCVQTYPTRIVDGIVEIGLPVQNEARGEGRTDARAGLTMAGSSECDVGGVATGGVNSTCRVSVR